MQSVPVFLYHSNVSFELRNISKMPKQYERRTKRRYDSTSDVHMADADEGGSSHPNVTSERTLRPRQRRAADTVARDSG